MLHTLSGTFLADKLVAESENQTLVCRFGAYFQRC